VSQVGGAPTATTASSIGGAKPRATGARPERGKSATHPRSATAAASHPARLFRPPAAACGKLRAPNQLIRNANRGHVSPCPPGANTHSVWPETRCPARPGSTMGRPTVHAAISDIKKKKKVSPISLSTGPELPLPPPPLLAAGPLKLLSEPRGATADDSAPPSASQKPSTSSTRGADFRRQSGTTAVSGARSAS